MATIHTKSHFDADDACKSLKKAMKGPGTNEAAIIKVLATHDLRQRLEIRAKYEKLFGKDLIKELKSELSGDFESTVLAMMTPVATYLAQELSRAMKGAGTKEKALIDILLPRTNAEVQTIKLAYQQEYGRELKADLKSELKGEIERLLVAQCNAQRDESHGVDGSRAERDAKDIFEAGEGKLGTDESIFTMILISRSYHQLKLTFEVYARLAGKDIEESIRRETKGNLRDGLLTVVNYVKGSSHYFAENLHHSMKGLGTDEKTLIRTIVTRAEVDLNDIAKAYAIQYGKSLVSAVSSELSGDFKKLILAVLGQH